MDQQKNYLLDDSSFLNTSNYWASPLYSEPIRTLHEVHSLEETANRLQELYVIPDPYAFAEPFKADEDASQEYNSLDECLNEAWNSEMQSITDLVQGRKPIKRQKVSVIRNP
jgi:hypothetical protein